METFRWFWNCVVRYLRGSTLLTLTNHLPSLPLSIYGGQGETPGPHLSMERHETMLLDILRAPPEYIDAAILMGRTAQALRKKGDDVFAEGIVVFALSRMIPDSDGTIAFKRLRVRLGDLPTRNSLIATLLRLEEQGVVEFTGDSQRDSASASHFMRLDDVRIRLRVLP